MEKAQKTAICSCGKVIKPWAINDLEIGFHCPYCGTLFNEESHEQMLHSLDPEEYDEDLDS